MTRTSAVCSLCAAALCAAVALAPTGCNEWEPEGLIILTPSEVTLRGASNAVLFVASLEEGEGNTQFFDTSLEWAVKTETLGTIRHAAGAQALYIRTTLSGDNYIYVEDGYGREGWAVVHQE